MWWRTEEPEPVSPLEVDKELAVDGRQVTPMQKMLSEQKSEFMSRLWKLILVDKDFAAEGRQVTPV